MSDFDKEAEREKLREKYEQDKEEREATQRMSDLLLKGATMTNAHCGTCGDPLFQENGTTFCPSCHGNPDAVRGTDLEAQPAEEGPADGETAATDAERTEGADASPADAADSDARSVPSEESATDDTASDPRQQPQTPRSDTDASVAESQSRSTPPSPSGRAEQSTPSRSDAVPSDTASSSAPADGRRSGSGTHRTAPVPTDGDLEAAHGALVRSLEKFAEEAAQTDDPRYATDCLEAAREAAETLSVLR
ncbi:Sjogren's syndrome/scleroderma autoantigen 1 family protein [Natrinema salsiterrestre]|uniref:Sjogrens syndrome scleroderma autoantigen 1 n=1 Tax=Natrinema salsiterrestre TaxID=2950540 RepID=A0A9Q4L5N0_9EURY|nr:Sjogren's syndrome/scleroderma autoantigen 1 family protein [Natrinema salsiterrestre]MDF9747739.1 hypothetical protein [Natrinema salsiterrestre]